MKLSFILILVAVYLIGARFPFLAQKVGLA